MISILQWVVNYARLKLRQLHDLIAPAELVAAEHMTGFWRSAAIMAAVELRLPDILAGEELSLEEIALRAESNPQLVERLLAALSSVGFFRKNRLELYSNSRLSNCLRFEGTQQAKLGPVAEFQWVVQWSNWEQLGKVVRFGSTSSSVKEFENGFGFQPGLAPITLFEKLKSSPSHQKLFHGAMSSVTTVASPALVSCYPWGQHKSIVDLGGGDGSFLQSLHKKYPKIRKCVIDQPDAKVSFEIKNGTNFISFEPGDFFQLSQSIAGFDAVVLKHILHDWKDAEVLKILSELKKWMNPKSFQQ